MHFKIEYDNSDGTVQTLIGYSMYTDHPEVAKDWLLSVRPGYPNLRNLRLADPQQQAIREALRISDAGFDDLTTINGDGDMIEESDGFYLEELPYTNDQYGDGHIYPRTPTENGDIARAMKN